LSKPKPDDPAQSERFHDLAKELEADGTADVLEKAVKTLAPQKRATDSKAKKAP